MSAAKLAAVLAVLLRATRGRATVIGEFDHAGHGNTLRVDYHGQKVIDPDPWEADVLGDKDVHLMDGHAIIVVN